jgi:hypothetical protein
MPKNEPPACVDCLHCDLRTLPGILRGMEEAFYSYSCKRYGKQRNVVTGKLFYIDVRCHIERSSDGPCGPLGKYFTPK